MNLGSSLILKRDNLTDFRNVALVELLRFFGSGFRCWLMDGFFSFTSQVLIQKVVICCFDMKVSRYGKTCDMSDIQPHECWFLIYFGLILVNLRSIQADIPLNNRLFRKTWVSVFFLHVAVIIEFWLLHPKIWQSVNSLSSPQILIEKIFFITQR